MNKNGKHGARYGTKERETKKFFGRISFRTFALSLVALIQIALLLVGATYSWVETISSIKFDGAKGNIGTAVKKLVKITDSSTNDISLDNYFREAGDVHLAACSSVDGENFYFPVIGGSSSEYRQGTINDMNVNYIDFTFQVRNDTTSAKSFRFNDKPEVSDDVRVAIYLDSATPDPKIFANKESTEPVVSSTDGTKTATNVKKFEKYTAGDQTESSVLFNVEKGSTSTVHVKIWLQEGSSSTENIDIKNFRLISGAAQRTVTVDYATGSDSSMGNIYVGDDTTQKVYGVVAEQEVTLHVSQTNEQKSTYKFMGWYENAACSSDPVSTSKEYKFKAGSSSKIFYARFSKVCKITLHAVECRESNCKADNKKICEVKIGDKGTFGDSISSTDYAVGDTVTLYSKSIDNSHEFVGWYKSETGEDVVYAQSQLSLALTDSDVNGIELYVKYKPKKITLSASVYKDKNNNFHGKVKDNDGEENTTVNVTTNYDGSVVSFTAIGNVGYVFEGWYKNENCTEKLTASDDNFTYTITNNVCNVEIKKLSANTSFVDKVTIYAKFRLKKYDVNISAKSFEYDGSKYTAVSDTKLLYGLVNYTYPGVTSPANAKEQLGIGVEYGNTLTLKNIDEKGYCSFEGWYTNENCTGDKLKSNEVTFDKDDDEGTVYNYYAKFVIKKGTVKVGTDSTNGTVYLGEDNGKTEGTYLYGSEVTLNATVKNDYKANYEFKGWYTKKDYSDDPLKDADGKVVGASYTLTVNSENVTYYAKFGKKQKTITVKGTPSDSFSLDVSLPTGTKTEEVLDGNVVIGKKFTVDYDSNITFTVTPKSNYRIDKWYTTEDESGILTDSDGKNEIKIASVNDGTSSLYKVKLIKTKDINVALGTGVTDGSVNINGTVGTTKITADYGSSVTLNAVASDGYAFRGWYTDASCSGNPVYSNSSQEIIVSDDTISTYYAKFENAIVVHLKNSCNWTDLHIYYWGGANDVTKWPGKACEEESGNNNCYKSDIPCDSNNFIFNNNAKGGQTVNISVKDMNKNNNYYDNRMGGWSKKPEDNTHRIIVSIENNNNSWDNGVYCHAWDSQGNYLTPDEGKYGKSMNYYDIKSGHKVYYIDIGKKYTYVIFTNGNSGGANQTVNVNVGNNDASYRIYGDQDTDKKYNNISEWR